MPRSDPARIELREAAQRLGVHDMTAYRYVRMGRLAADEPGAWRLVETFLGSGGTPTSALLDMLAPPRGTVVISVSSSSRLGAAALGSDGWSADAAGVAALLAAPQRVGP